MDEIFYVLAQGNTQLTKPENSLAEGGRRENLPEGSFEGETALTLYGLLDCCKISDK